ncbi:unnamed protein product [Zymoseptoria tritici ST99CH_3D7]|uniref:Vacuolar iron transporter Ccc1 n=1 Tax=Zymoseptoria tritici (strain ST99CH_3D7) TaxID=1276538 RepID=A0A1X7RU49_ZYMT9|nr:unnamed protein product [Zymoseptoria tritici ST99CH_3D7]
MVLALIKQLVRPTQRPSKSQDEYSSLLESGRDASSDSAVFIDDLTDKSTQEGMSRCRINPRIIADATIGLSDGLTVPFALTAGLSALGTTDLVVVAGFAELVAGAISMGLGGFLAAKGEADGYMAALQETKECVANDEQRACRMVRSTFYQYGFPLETLDSMTKALSAEPEQFVDFLMRFHHRLAEADFTASKALVSGLTISSGYFFGGLVPLLPYLFFSHVREAFVCSAFVMAIALFVFGWAKTSLVGESDRRACFRNAVEMLVLGVLAAAAAMGCVKAIGG